jgi:hypothetical protein
MIFERQNYTTEIGIECLNSCIANYFSFCGLGIKNYDIYFSGDGFNITYESKNDLPVLRSNMFNANFLFLNKYNIEYDYTNEKVIDPIEFLYNNIKSENLLSIMVNVSLLNYDAYFSSVYHNVPHFVNVIGIDDLKNKIYISDGYIPSMVPTKYEGWVDIETILKSWNMADNYYLKLNVQKISRATFDKTHTYSSLCTSIKRYNNITESNCRISGAKAVFRFFYYFKTAFENPSCDLMQLSLYINYHLKTGGFLINKKFTLELLKCEDVPTNLIERYSLLVDRWNYVFKQIVKVGVTKEKNHINALDEKIKELYDYEESCYQSILSFFGG